MSITTDFPKVIELNADEVAYLRRMMGSFSFSTLCFAKAPQFDARLNDVTEEEYMKIAVRLNLRMYDSAVLPILSLAELHVLVRAYVHGFVTYSRETYVEHMVTLRRKLGDLDEGIHDVLPIKWVEKLKGYTNEC